MDNKEKVKKINSAKQAALRKLVCKYPSEFRKLYNEERNNLGVPIKYEMHYLSRLEEIEKEKELESR